MNTYQPKRIIIFGLLSSCCAFLGCGEENAETKGPRDTTETSTTSTTPTAPFQVAAQPRLVWKQQTALAQDLSRALEIDPASLCNELGLTPCTKVHQASLGGNDPFQNGVYEPVAEPLATTPVVVDRLVLAACTNATERDLVEAPKVFTALDLTLDALDLNDPNQNTAVDATIRALYQRFLSRDATETEVSTISALATQTPALSARDFAKASCFAIGSTTEFLFY